MLRFTLAQIWGGLLDALLLSPLTTTLGHILPLDQLSGLLVVMDVILFTCEGV